MGFFSTLFGSNEFSSYDYAQQKHADLMWSERSAREMPLAQRQGLENAGYNPLLGQQASSAVELSGGASGAPQQGASEGENTAMSMMQMASMKKDMQIKDSQIDIARAEADVKKSEAEEIVRHNKEQERYESDALQEQKRQHHIEHLSQELLADWQKDNPEAYNRLQNFGINPNHLFADIAHLGKEVAKTVGAVVAIGLVGKWIGPKVLMQGLKSIRNMKPQDINFSKVMDVFKGVKNSFK